ncbi:glutathione-independent formaldehyde dehydrogenase [Geomesophilobacter sediminis]|uniref:Glutathione-independent formaldehyde dehydrogenase n=1 Tax=Geomesophilobacter sediminis TaxID=2798584 RepID=A0A8J7M086_9BACT|nr:glutathione-independent formaldehyde dehydrogenase [Geomesophilobacter sediminis]MBJ6723882.1 glutathione-independent formaldehyde dehydrogenase [Geomesophilobacter sediminis]
MKALVFTGIRRMELQEVPDPVVEQDGDAIIRVTSAAICGSDLHMYEGRTSAQPGMIFGHEVMGVVEKVGNGVQLVKVGDRVSLPFNVSCGACFNCVRGFVNACLTTNPASPGGGYGYADLGPYRGGQAQLLRVPFADFNCLKLPGTPGDRWEEDFIMLSDVLPTGYHATIMADVIPGSSVAVFGAGPVGYMAAMSAFLRGAAEVYVVDRSEVRLRKVAELGAVPINFTEGDPVEAILKLRSENKAIRESLRPGEEKMAGVLCGIDAVGYQAIGRPDPNQERPVQVIEDLARLVDATGSIGLIGVYFKGDPGGVDQNARQGHFTLPLGALWEKGIKIETGQAPVKRYNALLRDAIVQGQLMPGKFVSHKLRLENGPEAYEKFVQRGTGEGAEYTKIVLKPNG